MTRATRLLSEALEARRQFATITWDGGGLSSAWSNPQNWDSNLIPTAADTVDIRKVALVTIDNGSFEVGNFISNSIPNNTTLRINAGATLRVASGGAQGSKTLDLNGGTLISDGAYVVPDRHVFSWSSGTVAGSGSVKVRDSIVLPTSAASARLLTSTLILSGSGLVLNETIHLGDNLTPGLLQVYSGLALGTGSILAGGSAGGTVELKNYTEKTDTGTFTVGAGVVFAVRDALIIRGGLLDVDRIDFRETDDTGFELVIAFIAGEMRVRSGEMVGGSIKTDDFQMTGTFRLLGTVKTKLVGIRNNVNIVGGTVEGSGVGLTFWGSHIGTWSGTTVSAGSAAQLQSNAKTKLDTADPPKIGGTLINSASLTISTLRLTDALGNPGILSNLGTLNLTSASNIITPNLIAGGVATITNANKINVNAAGGSATDVVTLAQELKILNQSTGVLTIASGKLVLQQVPGTNPDTIEGGTWSVASGAALVLPDGIRVNRATITCAAGASISGLDGLNRNEGTLSLPPTESFAVTPHGGVFENLGILTFGEGTTFVVNGALLNSKTMTVGTGNVVADRFTNTAAGAISVVLAANAPPIFQVDLAAEVAGKLTVSGGTTSIVASDSQRLIAVESDDGAGVSGTFSSLVQPTSTTGRRLLLRYDLANVTIAVTPVAPSPPALTTASDTGISKGDGITRATSIDVVVSSVEVGTIDLWLDGSFYASAPRDVGASATINIPNLVEGKHVLVAQYTDSDGDASLSTSRNITVDRTRPTVSPIVYKFEQRPEFSVTFSESVFNYMSEKLLIYPSSGAAPRTAYFNSARVTWAFPTANPLPDDNYIATFADVGTDQAGNTVIGRSDHFFALAGDADRDRDVDFDDLLTLTRNYSTAGVKTFSQGNFDYLGAVTFDDLLILARNYGKTLPPSAPVTTGGATPLALSSEGREPRRRSVADEILIH